MFSLRWHEHAPLVSIFKRPRRTTVELWHLSKLCTSNPGDRRSRISLSEYKNQCSILHQISGFWVFISISRACWIKHVWRRLVAESIALPSGNLNVRHVTRYDSLSKTVLHGTLQRGRSRGRQILCWMNNIKEWTPVPMPELLTMVSRGKDWRSISGEPSFIPPLPRRPNWSRDWTELHWTVGWNILRRMVPESQCFCLVVAAEWCD